MNPSVSVAMFVHGAITFTGTIVRIVAQLIAGVIAFPIMYDVYEARAATRPSHTGELGTHITDPEFIFTLIWTPGSSLRPVTWALVALSSSPA